MGILLIVHAALPKLKEDEVEGLCGRAPAPRTIHARVDQLSDPYYGARDRALDGIVTRIAAREDR
ncbi:MAG: hypothetical protein IPG92_17785 [Flavobacteriales bacterium]|nr:hypothetical protein [Flavobacteriales bacterium]